MLQLFSPAKINLFLRIQNKRPDGYHNLSSLLQTIDLGDNITFQLHQDENDILTCSEVSLPTNHTNLILKATELFRQKTNLRIHLKIHLEKHIPTQAGLGGGSSNAATTLWAFNELSGKKIDIKQLMEWGAEIGSDVPFFLSQGTAHCTGRGEHVKNLASLGSISLFIVKPSIGLSTPAVYKRLRLPITFRENPSELEDFLSGKINCFNDLEQPAFNLSAELKDLKQYLCSRGFQQVLLSGSGSAFFCLGNGKIPCTENLAVYPANFVNREINNWYTKKE